MEKDLYAFIERALRSRIVASFPVAAALVMVLIVSAHAQTAVMPSGSGTSGSPYQIATLDNLVWVNQNSASWGDYFIQTADINADSTHLSSWNSGSGFSPIGNQATPFSGVYDGNRHAIDNLFISRGGTDFIGLFGDASGAQIKNIAVTGETVTGSVYVGGLVGFSESTSISNSHSSGAITGNHSSVGGIVGYSEIRSSVDTCYSTASATGGGYVGGLVGGNDSSSVSYCYSIGSVTGSGGSSSYIGGLVGYNNPSSTVMSCYSTGSVSAVGFYIGGLVGLEGNTSRVKKSFWDTETSGQSASAGGTPESDAAMKTEATYTDSSWDFTNIWSIQNGSSYPYLQSVPPLALPGVFAGGDGTSGSPLEVNTLVQLDSVRDYLGLSFIQTANINASATNSGSGFLPIGNTTTPFTGTYDGNGHTVDSLFISRSSTSYVGLFGEISGATVENIGVTNENITGASSVGGLVGYSYSSTVSRSYTSGSIAGNGNDIAGLVGFNYASSSITNSYSSASVTGGDYAGGLVGYDINSSISNCYSGGSISGSLYVGGLVGLTSGTSVSACFWDTQTSGQASSAAGTGLTSAQMREQTSFSGWDFSGTWAIEEAHSYPYLQGNIGSPLPGYNPFDGGDGSAGDPYQVKTLAELNSVGDYLGSHFIQTADINQQLL